MRTEIPSLLIMKHGFPFLFPLLILLACTKDKTPKVSASGYPETIAAIIDNKCSIAGCHNTQSKNGAADLDLSTWEKMFEGGSGGAVTVPYRHQQSTTFLFCNSDSTLGARAIPTMPYNLPPLSRNEIIAIRDWIDNGAPNKDGFVKFSDNPQRHKVYITNQGCDLVTVVDAETKLIMRYIPVGSTPATEGPHMVRVSPDGSFWCVCFIGGTKLQKFSAANDQLLGEAEIGAGNWNTLTISKDGTKAYCVDWNGNGNVKCVDLVNFTVTGGTGSLEYPHGSILSPDERYIYITGQTGNYVYKIDTGTFDYEQISADGNPPATFSNLDIHDIIFSPDGSKYFLSCQKTDEVRVMNTANDSLIAVIPVGKIPSELAVSSSAPLLFVTCMEDDNYSPKTGSVFIIDISNYSVIKSLYTGWQPHGIAIDEGEKLVYVVNRNSTPGGPAPHHTSDCGGRNGYFTLIDLNSLEMVPSFDAELSVDPYSAAYR